MRRGSESPPRHPSYSGSRRSGGAQPRQYESYRPPGGPGIPPPRLRDTFRREPRDERNDLQDRHSLQDRQYDRRDNYQARDDDREVDHLRRISPETRRYENASSLQQRHTSPTPTLPQHPTHFQHLSWKKPVDQAAAPRAEVNGIPLANKVPSSRLENLPVAQSVRQSPHIFIPASCLPPKRSTIKHLEALRDKHVPKEGEVSQHVFMDDTGYYVTFPHDAQGKYQQALWFASNKHTKIFGQYGLESMISYPGDHTRTADQADPSGPGRSNTSALAKSGNRDHDEEPPVTGVDDVNFSIRGAAGYRNPATLRDRGRSAGESEFAIRGAATSPGLNGLSPTAGALGAIQRSDVFSSARLPGTSLFPNKTSSTNGGSQPQSHDRDDAASSVSGVTGSDVSGSKPPGCHACGQRGTLFKCSTCPRRWHKHCHVDPPIPEHPSSQWQDERCLRKGVLPKRNVPGDSNPDVEPSAHKKQRLSSSATSRPDPIFETPLGMAETHGITQNALPSLASVSRQDENGKQGPTVDLPAALDEDPTERLVNRMADNIEAANLDTAPTHKSVATPAIEVDGPILLLGSDDEANHLVAESFAAPVAQGATAKKGGKLRTVKHRISVAEPQTTDAGRGETAASTPLADKGQPDSTAAFSSRPQPSSSRLQSVEPQHRQSHTAVSQDTVTAKTSYDSSHLRMDSTVSPVIDTRSSRNSKKAKKTHGKPSRCTSCKVQTVPYNPLGGTTCHLCKDKETKTQESRRAKAAEPSSQLPLKDVGSQRNSEAVSAIQPSVPHTALNEEGNELRSSTLYPAPAGISANEPAALDPEVPPATEAETRPKEPPAANVTAAPQPGENQGFAAESTLAEHEPQPQPQAEDVRSSPSDTDGTDEDEDIARSTLISKRALNPKLIDRPSSSAEKVTRKTQRVSTEDPYYLGNSRVRPKGTYSRLINMAMSEAPNGKLTPHQVVQWVSDNIPGYSLNEGTWHGGVKSTMIFKCDHTGKNGVATLRRSQIEGSGELQYELLPEWKGKVERWDAGLARPVLPSPSAKQVAVEKDQGKSTELELQSKKKKGPTESELQSKKKKGPTGSELQSKKNQSPTGSEPQSKMKKSPMAAARPTGLLRLIKRTGRKRTMKALAMEDRMDIDSGCDSDFDSDDGTSFAGLPSGHTAVAGSSTNNTAAEAEAMDVDSLWEEAMDQPSTPVQFQPEGHATEDVDVDALFEETTRAPDVETKPFDINDMTAEYVLARLPKPVHTNFDEAWPSLSRRNQIDWDARRAEIAARPGRKARFGRKRSVDVEKILAPIVPSKDERPTASDNMTQEEYNEHYGEDGTILVPCDTWEEFFGGTETVKPCIVEGQLAFRPTGKSRTVYKSTY